MGIHTDIQRKAFQAYIDAGAPEMTNEEAKAWSDGILRAQIDAAGPEMREFMEYCKSGRWREEGPAANE